MATKAQVLMVHPALGGLDATRAPSLLPPDWLAVADNIEYDTSGARKKRLGTARYNSAQVTEAGSAITFTGLFDYWKIGTSLSPTQKFVAYGGTQIFKDDGDGVWDSLKTGLESGKIPSFFVMRDLLILASTSTVDVPQKWNQTDATTSNLGGTPPNFSFGKMHKNRAWAAGVASNPSRLYYSASLNEEDWVGSGSGSIDIDPEDGDYLNGISETWRNDLYLFKGPHYGSIHRIQGSAPSDFSRSVLLHGIDCVAHNSVITTPNDIFWASRRGIHSLVATDKFGDLEEGFLSRPIQTIYRGINSSRLAFITGVYHSSRNYVGWLVSDGGQSQNDLFLVYNVVLQQWAVWKGTKFKFASAMVGIDPSTKVRRIYCGDYNGFVEKGDQTTLSDDGSTAYSAKIKTGVIARFSEEATELVEKQMLTLTTFFKPKGDYTANVDIRVDNRSQATSFNQQGGGATLDTFVLNTDVLGGTEFNYSELPIEDKGRSIEIQWSNGGANQDVEIVGYALRYVPAEPMALESA